MLHICAIFRLLITVLHYHNCEHKSNIESIGLRD